MNQNTNQNENLQKFAINLCERASDVMMRYVACSRY